VSLPVDTTGRRRAPETVDPETEARADGVYSLLLASREALGELDGLFQRGGDARVLDDPGLEEREVPHSAQPTAPWITGAAHQRRPLPTRRIAGGVVQAPARPSGDGLPEIVRHLPRVWSPRMSAKTLTIGTSAGTNRYGHRC
jgi:hypothetical protein